MKRNFTYKALTGALLALAIALVAQSCHHVDPEIGVQRAIGFSALETKVSGLDDLKSSEQGFGVSAKAFASGAAGVDVFYNQEVVWQTSAWVYSPTKYWMTGNTYRFVAYWPYSPSASISGNFENGVTISGFVIDEDPSEQVDYLVTDVVERDCTESNIDEPVEMLFNHALCNINIQLSSNSSSCTYSVKSVALSGTSSSGSYKLTASSSSPSGWTGEWQLNAGTNHYEVDYSDAPQPITSSSSIITVWSDGLLLFPQTIDNSIQITLEYDVTHNGQTKSVLTSVQLPSVPLWQSAKKITYKLLLPEENDYIKFATPVVEEWGSSQATGTIVIR